jgi:ketosteroid isomerase-like protein
MASAHRQTNVAIVQGLYDAFNDHDIETALATMTDDVEWTEPAGSPFGGTVHGPDAVNEHVFEPCMEMFDPFTVDPDRFVDGGDTVVALGKFHATTSEGKKIVSPFAHIWTVEDGKIAGLTNYTDTALWM